MTIARLRKGVFILGGVSLLALFQTLSLTPAFLKVCTTCTSENVYLPYLGIAYFCLLMTVSLLFPTFPHRSVARVGLLGALLLALALTLLHAPKWCIACLLAHGCHIAIWILWCLPVSSCGSVKPLRERLLLASLPPLCVLLLAGYVQFFAHPPLFTTGLRPGESIEIAPYKAANGVVINFISSNCPFCKIQLPLINALSQALPKDGYRVMNIVPQVTPELVAQAPDVEWIEDAEGVLHEEFQILAHPTLFVIDGEGTIRQIVSGIPDNLEAAVLSTLKTCNNE